ncbi:hypothetical protein VV867_11960 [Pseudomonas sp. JH-2]|nr:hypothetical protein [Pseudomonas sp. JH-2]
MQASANYEDQGLVWMYGHLRRIGCTVPTSLYRSLRFRLWGDTGNFRSTIGWQKLRFRRTAHH